MQEEIDGMDRFTEGDYWIRSGIFIPICRINIRGGVSVPEPVLRMLAGESIIFWLVRIILLTYKMPLF
jgi:hypothetical protein